MKAKEMCMLAIQANLSELLEDISRVAKSGEYSHESYGTFSDLEIQYLRDQGFSVDVQSLGSEYDYSQKLQISWMDSYEE